MSQFKNCLSDFFCACEKYGVVPTQFILVVNAAEQTVSLFGKPVLRSGGWQNTRFPGSRPGAATREFQFVKRFRCSTSRFGIGQNAGSNCTPLGLHRIAEKIGGGWPVGTVFKSRKPIGYTWRGMPDAKITTRILWLEGLEPGLNRGGKVDSHARYIYIHGTGDEMTLGHPASCGCVHLAAKDLVPLFDKLPIGTLVWISES